jgi:hypothetical protein
MGRFVNRRMASKDRKNNTGDKKNNNFPGVIGSIDKYLGVFLKALPVFGVFATISLLFYADKENVDIFNYYSSWLSIVPIVAVVELVIAIIVIVIAFMPVLIFYIFLLIDKGSAAALKSDDLRTLYAYFYGIFASAVLFLGLDFLATFFVTALIMIAPLFYMKFLEHKKDALSFSKRKTYFILLATGFIAIFLGYFFKYIYFGAFDDRDIYVLLVICFIGVLVFIVYHSNSGESRSQIIILSLFSVGVLLLFIMPISSTILEVSLRKIGLGGGVEKVYLVNSGNRSKIPDIFINDCCKDRFCITNKLSIIWGVGDLVYVDVPSKENPPIKQHIAIPRNILMPYKLEAPLSSVCKAEEALKEVSNKGQKEEK